MGQVRGELRVLFAPIFGLGLIVREQVIDFEPKRMEEYDVEIAINCCGESLYLFVAASMLIYVKQVFAALSKQQLPCLSLHAG